MSIADQERAWLRDVGMRVRLARVALRESQDALAARADVSRVTLGSVERGDHPAGVLTYAWLAQTIGMSLGELLAGVP